MKANGRARTLVVLPDRVFVDGVVVPEDVETEQPHDQRVDGGHQPEDTKNNDVIHRLKMNIKSVLLL